MISGSLCNKLYPNRTATKFKQKLHVKHVFSLQLSTAASINVGAHPSKQFKHHYFPL